MSPEDDEFQITLPSNASMALYPENKPQLYRTELATPLTLSGKWEVAIVDIQIPHKWLTIQQDQTFEVYVRVVPYVDGRYSEDLRYPFEVVLSRGYYKDIQALLNFMCREITRVITSTSWISITGKVSASYDSNYDRVEFSYEGNCQAIWLGLSEVPVLTRILGISSNRAFRTILIPFSSDGPSINDTISSIFIYSDIVKHQLVGDSSAQLIGICPIKGHHNELIYWAFNPILYRPVCKGYIKDIEMQLCSSDGNLIPIIQGNTIVRLHFRKVK